MNYTGRVQDFHLPVDPYVYLDIEKGCRDLRKIKHAYRKKSILLHPDKSQFKSGIEFDTLNKCYIYLKTLCKELEGTGLEYSRDLDERIQRLQNTRSVQTERPLPQYTSNIRPRRSDVEIPERFPSSTQRRNHPLAPPMHQEDTRVPRISLKPSGSGGSSTGKRRVDFEQQIQDNCVIGADQFDANRVFNDMMRCRPTSTNYRDISVDPTASYGDLELDKDNLDGFTTFDEMGSVASIVSDGDFMFVESKPQVEDVAAISNFGMITQFSEYDKELERKRYADKGTGIVSNSEARDFQKMYDSCSDSSIQKPTQREFKERLSLMNIQHQDQVDQQRLINKKRVEQYLPNLSPEVRANLLNYRRIVG